MGTWAPCYPCGMSRAGRVVDHTITVFVLGIFLAPIALYALLVVSAFSFYVVSWVWPCEWPLHQAFVGFNPSCPGRVTTED
jgi:hypothetical protein